MEVVYLEKLQGLHAVGLMSSRVGGRSPAYCTGLGKVLLAYTDLDVVRNYFNRVGLYRYTPETIHTVDNLIGHLRAVQAQGYSFDHGEHEAEVRCVAAPIFDIKGHVVAAISLSGPAARLDPIEEKQDLINRVQETARLISINLGFRPSD
jgi:DNA-binding IclR family transcriptional regulator